MSKPITICLLVALAVAAWLFRFDLVAANDSSMVYRLDRWTGNIMVAGALGTKQLEPVRQTPPNPFDQFDGK